MAIKQDIFTLLLMIYEDKIKVFLLYLSCMKPDGYILNAQTQSWLRELNQVVHFNNLCNFISSFTICPKKTVPIKYNLNQLYYIMLQKWDFRDSLKQNYEVALISALTIKFF